MPDTRGLRRAAVLPCLLVLLAALGCDEQPQIHSDSAPASAGGLQFELGDYEIHYLELAEDGETVVYDDPVLVVELSISNIGDQEFIYNPTHTASEVSEARTPLLFPDPQPEADEIDWETFSPEPLTAVDFEAGRWDDQIRESTPLAPGENLTDYFLFDLPDEDEQPMMFSIPPTMHHGELPTFIRFDYSRPEPQTPPVYAVHDQIDFDGVHFTVHSIEQTWVEMEDQEDGEGFSDEALLRVEYTVDNESEDTLLYQPGHDRDSGQIGPVIESDETDFLRVYSSDDTHPVGQNLGSTSIEPGDTIEDFALFKRPDTAVDDALFVFAADHFDRSGRVRVQFDYEKQDVEMPEQLEED